MEVTNTESTSSRFREPLYVMDGVVLPPIDVEGKRVVSFSQLEMFDQCPKKWKLLYIDKAAKKLPALALIYGNAMHHVLQSYLRTMFTESQEAADSLDLETMLLESMSSEFVQSMEKLKSDIKDGEEPLQICSREEFSETFNDGCSVIAWFKKHRMNYFQRSGWELVGLELPLFYPIEDGSPIHMIAYLDVVLRNVALNQIKIVDFKTSKNGWSDYAIRGKSAKMHQIVLYKEYYAKQYGVNPDKVNVQFVVLKSKTDITDKKRIQIVAPPSGAVSRRAAIGMMQSFVQRVFNDDGTVRSDLDTLRAKSSPLCKFCPFYEAYDLCPNESREQ